MNEVPGRDPEDCQCTWHKVGSSRLVTGSHSSLEFDLLEQADPGALVQAIANLRMRKREVQT